MRKFRWMMPRLEQEGAVGASSAPDVSAAPSVAAGGQSEPPGTGNAPAPAPTAGAPAGSSAPGTGAPDVSQQESFAARLKEERSKIEADYTPYKTTASQLERIAKDAGFKDTAEYLTALDNHVREQVAAEEAKRLGVDQETYNQFFAPVHSELQQTKTQLQQLQQADIRRQIQADYESLKKEYGQEFESVQEKVFDLAEQRRLPLADAFKLVSFDSKVAAAKLEGQAAAVAAIRQNAESSTGSVGGDAPNQTFDFTKLSPAEREKYYEKAKRGELKSLR